MPYLDVSDSLTVIILSLTIRHVLDTLVDNNYSFVLILPFYPAAVSGTNNEVLCMLNLISFKTKRVALTIPCARHLLSGEPSTKLLDQSIQLKIVGLPAIHWKSVLGHRHTRHELHGGPQRNDGLSEQRVKSALLKKKES